ncbi:MAG: PAS domain S-box protein [Gammaproteobacteria bacterium]|nr:PAS domain S-box protein [Gammaproteobacteria bacterium]
MPDPTEQKQVNRLDLAVRFLAVFLPFLAVFAVATAAHFLSTQHAQRVSLHSKEILNVGLARSAVVNDLAGVFTDLLFLADYVQHQETGKAEQLSLRDIGELFRSFARQKRFYDQIRLLDVSGLELVRINYRDGTPVIEDELKLQNKSDRYYVQEALRLGPNDVYVSPLDLNIEHGEIEQPLKPMMRFAVSIFNPQGRRQRLLVLNYLGARLLNHFRRATSNAAEAIYLLNNEGYWLSSPRDQDAWGFMLPHGRNFAQADSAAWQRIRTEVAGQFNSGDSLYTFETITPKSVAEQLIGNKPAPNAGASGSGQMKVVAKVRETRGFESLVDFLIAHLPLYSTTFLVLLIGSVLLAKANLHRRQAELQSAYERKFRHTLEDIQLAAISIGKSGRLEFCNDYFLYLCDRPVEEAVGQDWLAEFVTDEQRPLIQQTFSEFHANGQFPREMELILKTRQPNDRLMAWHNTLMWDADGKVTGITCLGEDITDRRRAEEQVRKLSRAVEQSPSIVMLTNRFGRIEYVNPKFVEVTGYSKEDVLGKNPRLLKSGETEPSDYQRLWQSISEGGEWHGEFHNRRKNGELYWESASISGLRGPNGMITHYVAVKEDITARKRLEAEIDARKRELARAESLAAMGRMASMIAHDLRNPLSSVKMGVQIMGKQGDEQTRELGDIALEQIHYMESILRDMLTYARPEDVRTEWVSVDKLLELSIRSLSKQIEEKGVVVSSDYEQGLPTIPADPDKLRQVFSNLLSNALQAISGLDANEGRIDVRAKLDLGDDGSIIDIEICDNGKGIDSSEVEKLFEPFYTTRAKGTGLGLAICRQIIEQHRGSVTLQPRAPAGVCACVLLPTTPSATPGSE